MIPREAGYVWTQIYPVQTASAHTSAGSRTGYVTQPPLPSPLQHSPLLSSPGKQRAPNTAFYWVAGKALHLENTGKAVPKGFVKENSSGMHQRTGSNPEVTPAASLAHRAQALPTKEGRVQGHCQAAASHMDQPSKEQEKHRVPARW